MSEQQPEDEATETPQTDADQGDDQTGDQSTDQSTDQNDGAAETKADDDSSGSGLEESEPGDIGDDKLPEDLQPTEDNPLARHPGQTGDDDDKIGADGKGSDSENPSANMAYGSEDSNAPSDEPGSDNDDSGSDDSGSDDSGSDDSGSDDSGSDSSGSDDGGTDASGSDDSENSAETDRDKD